MFVSAGLVVLAAAWHPGDTPCLAYFCLVTLAESTAPSPDLLIVEVTKYNPPFQVHPSSIAEPSERIDCELLQLNEFCSGFVRQSEEELQKTRLVLPEPSSPAAYLYNEELVFTCSTGAGRGSLAEEKISFSSPGTSVGLRKPNGEASLPPVVDLFSCVCYPGDHIRGGGVCAGLPVFFSQNSGLVAVLARESASLLPEDSLCTSVAGPGPEVWSQYILKGGGHHFFFF